MGNKLFFILPLKFITCINTLEQSLKTLSGTRDRHYDTSTISISARLQTCQMHVKKFKPQNNCTRDDGAQ